MKRGYVKRLLAVAMSVTMLLGLTACGNQQTDASATDDSVVESVEESSEEPAEESVEASVEESVEESVAESVEEPAVEEPVVEEPVVVDNRDKEGFESYAASYADGDFIVDKTYTTMNLEAITDTGAGIIPDSKDWFFAVGAFGGEATVALEELEQGTFAKIDITNGGSQNYAVQLIQHMPVIKGYTYKITFDAKASEARTFVLSPSGDGDNSWAKYATHNPSVGTEMESFSYEFTMDSATDPTARLEFNLGQATGTIWIGNVTATIVEAE